MAQKDAEKDKAAKKATETEQALRQANHALKAKLDKAVLEKERVEAAMCAQHLHHGHGHGHGHRQQPHDDAEGDRDDAGGQGREARRKVAALEEEGARLRHAIEEARRELDREKRERQLEAEELEDRWVGCVGW